MGFLSAYFMQTLGVTLTVWEIIALKVVFFYPPLSLMIEKTRQFWTVTNIFSERFKTIDVIEVKIFPKCFTFRHNERKRDGRGGKMTDFSMFFDRCDLVFGLF